MNNQPGVYGTQGAAGADNIPPPRNNATSWIDAAGNFWLFGGSGWSWDYNDLWKYSGGKWTWVSGSNQTSQTGIYEPGDAGGRQHPRGPLGRCRLD